MASLITVRLNKGDAPSLGFRIQGGKDFGTPLVIQKVNGGSPAERAGLIAGDSVIKINNTDVFNLRHKDAQDVIVRSGHNFEVTVQRGGSTWKPSVIPTGPLSSASSISPVTKTSLAAGKRENIDAIGTGHNVAAKPYTVQLNGAVNGGPKLVNNQFNSPLKLYSEESIAETLSAQTEVLSTGALGVNFKKNEKNYDANNSAVFRMLQEAEKEPKSPQSVTPTRSDFYYPPQDHGRANSTLDDRSCLGSRLGNSPGVGNSDQEGTTRCTDCDRVIVGVFVRIKDKNLHVECFKCSTCGSSLKNVGYYNIQNKLYCDVHAKLAARNNPPGSNLVPVTVQPGERPPPNAISSPSHSLPSPSPLSPRFNVSQPYQPGNFSTPAKPFSSVSAPVSTSPNYNTLPKAPSNYNTLPKAPSLLSPVALAPARSFAPSTDHVYNIVWPPPLEEPEVPTACPLYFSPNPNPRVIPRDRKPSELSIQTESSSENLSQFEEDELIYTMDENLPPKRSEFCEFTEKKSVTECVEAISESLQTQQLVETVLKDRGQSPSNIADDVLNPKIRQIPLDLVQTSTVEASTQEYSSSLDVTTVREQSVSKSEKLELSSDYRPNTVEGHLSGQVKNSVPQKWESPMLQALRIDPDNEKNADAFVKIPTKHSMSALSSALSIAPSKPFTAPSKSGPEIISLPEETVPYFPPEHHFIDEFIKHQDPVPAYKKKKDPPDDLFKDLPKPEKKLTIRDALTTAPERPYTPLSPEPKESEPRVNKVDKQNLKRPLKPPNLPESFQTPSEIKPQPPKLFPVRIEEIKQEKRHLEKEVDTKQSTVVEKHKRNVTEQVVSERNPENPQYPLFTGFSCSFANKSDLSQFEVQVSTAPPVLRTPTPSSVKITTSSDSDETTTAIESKQEIECKSEETIAKQSEEVVLKKTLPLSSALHKAQMLPQYQVNISDEAEADLQVLEMMEAARLRHEQKKCSESKQNIETSIERPPSVTFSLTPTRSITPSMINRPPSIIPYYQSNLVAQQHRAPSSNLLDPKSPGVSRSPSPCPSPSPFSSASTARPKSPAQGPPPNPLPKRGPTPDPKFDQVRSNISSFIAHTSQASEAVPLTRGEHDVKKPSGQDQLVGRGEVGVTCSLVAKRQVEDKQTNLISTQQLQNASMTTAVSEKSHEDHVEAIKQSQSVNVEESADRIVQRKQIVTEEYEHTHKEKTIEVAKSVTHHSFRDVKNPEDEVHGIVGCHVTNPRPVISRFLRADQECKRNSTEVESQPLTETTLQPLPPLVMKDLPTSIVSAPSKNVTLPSGSAHKPNPTVTVNKSNIPTAPNTGSGGGRQSGAIGVAPRRGRGVLNKALAGSRVALCASCHSQIRGPFITALGKIWCPDHFSCATPSCKRPLQDLGFVEEQGQLYCEYCFEQYLAPPCSKCQSKIKGDCLKAIGKNFHPECFNCVYCGKLFANSPFFLEDGSPYCEADWNELFTTKCFACGFPVEAGDRWVEALNNNYHSQCFNCTMCKKNLEGQSFFAKGGRPFCKNHAR